MYKYDGAVWLPYFKDFVDDFMRNSNLGIRVLHVKCRRILYDVISLLAQVCIVSSNRVS